MTEQHSVCCRRSSSLCILRVGLIAHLSETNGRVGRGLIEYLADLARLEVYREGVYLPARWTKQKTDSYQKITLEGEFRVEWGEEWEGEVGWAGRRWQREWQKEKKGKAAEQPLESGLVALKGARAQINITTNTATLDSRRNIKSPIRTK